MKDKDKKTVLAVFGTLLQRFGEDDLRLMIGSETIERMKDLYHRLRYEPYCKEHGIKVKDMTEDDYINEYEERCREMGGYDE